MSEATAQLNKAIAQKQGKYLTFVLGDEEYGLEILKVREIIGYMDITAVPQTPNYVRGVINLRGQIVPVVDLRAKFGMEAADTTRETAIIVVETTQNNHKFGTEVKTDFILGMGKVGESVKILLDIDKALAETDLAGISEVAQQHVAQ